eukprot:TRINITY_DN962_c0_g1_i3.p1 TRINITY_DN962_c0_g1~~TRINITY_DN962_c0_g1_i3.p1  ORF type:complete len:1836 (-),score=241.53 TRINITY_DN962_c0_g1_i3:135-5642(-)
MMILLLFALIVYVSSLPVTIFGGAASHRLALSRLFPSSSHCASFGATLSCSDQPDRIFLASIDSIAMGGSQVCVLLATGEVLCMRGTAAPETVLEGASGLAMADERACAIAARSVFCWAAGAVPSLVFNGTQPEPEALLLQAAGPRLCVHVISGQVLCRELADTEASFVSQLTILGNAAVELSVTRDSVCALLPNGNVVCDSADRDPRGHGAPQVAGPVVHLSGPCALLVSGQVLCNGRSAFGTSAEPPLALAASESRVCALFAPRTIRCAFANTLPQPAKRYAASESDIVASSTHTPTKTPSGTPPPSETHSDSELQSHSQSASDTPVSHVTPTPSYSQSESPRLGTPQSRTPSSLRRTASRTRSRSASRSRSRTTAALMANIEPKSICAFDFEGEPCALRVSCPQSLSSAAEILASFALESVYSLAIPGRMPDIVPFLELGCHGIATGANISEPALNHDVAFGEVFLEQPKSRNICKTPSNFKSTHAAPVATLTWRDFSQCLHLGRIQVPFSQEAQQKLQKYLMKTEPTARLALKIASLANESTLAGQEQLVEVGLRLLVRVPPGPQANSSYTIVIGSYIGAAAFVTIVLYFFLKRKPKQRQGDRVSRRKSLELDLLRDSPASMLSSLPSGSPRSNIKGSPFSMIGSRGPAQERAHSGPGTPEPEAAVPPVSSVAQAMMFTVFQASSMTPTSNLREAPGELGISLESSNHLPVEPGPANQDFSLKRQKTLGALLRGFQEHEHKVVVALGFQQLMQFFASIPQQVWKRATLLFVAFVFIPLMITAAYAHSATQAELGTAILLPFLFLVLFMAFWAFRLSNQEGIRGRDMEKFAVLSELSRNRTIARALALIAVGSDFLQLASLSFVPEVPWAWKMPVNVGYMFFPALSWNKQVLVAAILMFFFFLAAPAWRRWGPNQPVTAPYYTKEMLNQIRERDKFVAAALEQTLDERDARSRSVSLLYLRFASRWPTFTKLREAHSPPNASMFSLVTMWAERSWLEFLGSTNLNPPLVSHSAIASAMVFVAPPGSDIGRRASVSAAGALMDSDRGSPQLTLESNLLDAPWRLRLQQVKDIASLVIVTILSLPFWIITGILNHPADLFGTVQLPLLTVCLQSFACRAGPFANSVLIYDPNIICWRDSHILYAAIGFLGALLVIGASFLLIFKQRGASMMVQPNFRIAQTLGRMAIAIAVSFTGGQQTLWQVPLSITAAVTLWLFYLNLKLQPTLGRMQWTNRLRSCAYSGAILLFCCALLNGNPSGPVKYPLFIYAALLVPVGVGTWLLHPIIASPSPFPTDARFSALITSTNKTVRNVARYCLFGLPLDKIIKLIEKHSTNISQTDAQVALLCAVLRIERDMVLPGRLTPVQYFNLLKLLHVPCSGTLETVRLVVLDYACSIIKAKLQQKPSPNRPLGVLWAAPQNLDVFYLAESFNPTFTREQTSSVNLLPALMIVFLTRLMKHFNRTFSFGQDQEFHALMNFLNLGFRDLSSPVLCDVVRRFWFERGAQDMLPTSEPDLQLPLLAFRSRASIDHFMNHLERVFSYETLSNYSSEDLHELSPGFEHSMLVSRSFFDPARERARSRSRSRSISRSRAPTPEPAPPGTQAPAPAEPAPNQSRASTPEPPPSPKSLLGSSVDGASGTPGAQGVVTHARSHKARQLYMVSPAFSSRKRMRLMMALVETAGLDIDTIFFHINIGEFDSRLISQPLESAADPSFADESPLHNSLVDSVWMLAEILNRPTFASVPGRVGLVNCSELELRLANGVQFSETLPRGLPFFADGGPKVFERAIDYIARYVLAHNQSPTRRLLVETEQFAMSALLRFLGHVVPQVTPQQSFG